MKSRRFELFERVVGGLPAKGALRAIELEARMIKDDLICRREIHCEDAISILNFCHFLHAAKSGGPFFQGVLSAEHMPFYDEIVKRLISAGELPQAAKKQFDDVFLSDFMKRIAA
jgi:hypothetical protein